MLGRSGNVIIENANNIFYRENQTSEYHVTVRQKISVRVILRKRTIKRECDSINNNYFHRENINDINNCR